MSGHAALPQGVTPDQRHWIALFEAYQHAWPDEAGVVALFRELASTDDAAASRARRAGHLTGSAWLVSADGERVLLTHHRKLDRWLQLGGHADGDGDLARVALREAEEESGLLDLEVETIVFDLDRHRIPARGDEPEHWHYDVRFVVRARGSEAYVVGAESHALAWRRIADIAHDEAADASLRRMARKWLARGA
jgi:8-oxo-dGTP pyrophosphatase MutT (NUDIX family)